jgi:hypothetical protein
MGSRAEMFGCVIGRVRENSLVETKYSRKISTRLLNMIMTIAVTNMLIRYVHTALNIHVVIHVRKYVNCNTCATHVRQTP